jgi:hypothetical protein
MLEKELDKIYQFQKNKVSSAALYPTRRSIPVLALFHAS